MFEVFPDISPRPKPGSGNDIRFYIEKAVHTGKPTHVEAFRYDVADAKGRITTKYWQGVYTPIFDTNKKVCQILSTVHDVTAEVRAAQRATIVEDRLQTALTVGKVGSWVYDLDTHRIAGDRNLARLFHFQPQTTAKGIARQEFMKMVHPDDKERLHMAVQNSIGKRLPFNEEFRLVRSDNTERWSLARGKVDEYDGKTLFSGVIVDITERHDLEVQVELAHQQDQLNRRIAKMLQKRNRELEAIGRSKDEFVALASHQLRTPATAVKQYLGMVLQGYTGDLTDEQAEMLAKAFDSNERQIQIINQILHAARADTGRLMIAPIPLDLRTLVRGVWSDMRSSFEQRHHSYSISLPRTPLVVAADQGYLRMAIENVLYNACVYTPEGGSITARLSRTGKRCELTVADTGVGIRKSDFNKLFAKFSRIHNPLSVQAGGSGIGLYLTSEIVRLHSGSVGVHSRLHHGTTFAISLPLVQNTT